MLQQIDTAIGFAVVMLILSLIVTAIVQMISALTDLRGRNLASGLANLLHQIEPSLRDKFRANSTVAEYIANVVVKHPAIAHAGTRAKAIGESERIYRQLTQSRLSPSSAASATGNASERPSAFSSGALQEKSVASPGNEFYVIELRISRGGAAFG